MIKELLANKRSVSKVTKVETLLNIGIVLCSAGSAAIMAKDYILGFSALCAGMAVVYFRGLVKD